MHIEDFLREAAQNNAADIFLAAGAVPCMNVAGVYLALRSAEGQRMRPEQIAEFARQMMTERQWKDFENSLEANLAYMAEGIGRFRINAFWQRGSPALVCRRVIMDIPTLRSLGLPPVLRNISFADRGIVLVTGSTGSGKSTSLASMIDYRNHIRTGHIVTIEDPVEFIYRHRRSIVTQREVGIDTLSFHEALKNTLRQAPSVICIGEMRDAETVQFAMHASETGHLVFATLHSTNSILAIERILHFYPGEMKDQIQKQLALNLKAIICQRLVPKLGGGRAVAIEVMVNTPRVIDLISKGSLGEVREAIAAENQEGMVNFDKSLFRLCKQKKITYEDALQAAESANDLALKFKGIGIAPGSSWEDMRDPWEQIAGDYEPPQDNVVAQRMRDAAATGGYTNENAPSLPGVGRSQKLVNEEQRSAEGKSIAPQQPPPQQFRPDQVPLGPPPGVRQPTVPQPGATPQRYRPLGDPPTGGSKF